MVDKIRIPIVLKDEEGQIQGWLQLFKSYQSRARGDKRDLVIAGLYFYTEWQKVKKTLDSVETELCHRETELLSTKTDLQQARQEALSIRIQLRDDLNLSSEFQQLDSQNQDHK